MNKKEMRKRNNGFVIVQIVIMSICIVVGGCHNQRESNKQNKAGGITKNTDREQQTAESSVDQLKAIIDSAEIITYWDKTYKVRVPYLDCFVIKDTAEVGTARFRLMYNGETVGSGVFFVEPNVDGWDIKEAVRELSDSTNHCFKEGEDFYIMTGEVSNLLGWWYVEKCFLVENKWINYTLYYSLEYKDAVERIVKMVLDWEW